MQEKSKLPPVLGSVGVKLLSVISDNMSLLWLTVLKPAIEDTAIIRTTVPPVSTALSFVDVSFDKGALQLVSVLDVYDA